MEKGSKILLWCQSYFKCTVKNLKIGTSKIIYSNCPTNGTVGFYSAVLHSKDADRIPNRVDPNQTTPRGAVWSGSALFSQTCLSQYFKLLRYIEMDGLLCDFTSFLTVFQLYQNDGW